MDAKVLPVLIHFPGAVPFAVKTSLNSLVSAKCFDLITFCQEVRTLSPISGSRTHISVPSTEVIISLLSSSLWDAASVCCKGKKCNFLSVHKLHHIVSQKNSLNHLEYIYRWVRCEVNKHCHNVMIFLNASVIVS